MIIDSMREIESIDPLTGPRYYGTTDQRRTMFWFKTAGWTFLHWTDVPKILAVMESPSGRITFVDDRGSAWRGPVFSSEPLSLEDYPPTEWDCVT